MLLRCKLFLFPFLICVVIGIGTAIGFLLSAFVMFYDKHPGAPMDLFRFVSFMVVSTIGTLPLRLFYTVTSQQHGVAWALVDNWVGIGAVVGLIVGALRASRRVVGNLDEEE